MKKKKFIILSLLIMLLVALPTQAEAPIIYNHKIPIFIYLVNNSMYQRKP